MGFADRGGACRMAVNEDRMSFLAYFQAKKNAWVPNEQDVYILVATALTIPSSTGALMYPCEVLNAGRSFF